MKQLKSILQNNEKLQRSTVMMEDYYIVDRVAISAMKQFGKQCFNAARETDNIIVGDIDDLPGVSHKDRYKDFNDYLKQLENAD